jgi:ferredoxin
MGEKNFNLTRRKFMAVSSTAIAAPFVMKMTGTVPHVEAAAKEVNKKYAGMKSIVIYYSMTGNTKKIAQGIQKGITQRTGQCDIVRLKDAKLEELAKYDLIGIGAPTYSSRVAPHFVDYVKSLPPNIKGKHTFFYSTHGVLPGRVIMSGVKPLQEVGLTVIGWKDWYGSCPFLPGHSKPWITDGHPDAIDIAEAETFGTAMVELSRKISEGKADRIPELPSPEAIDAFYGWGYQVDPDDTLTSHKLPGSDFTRRVNTEKCIGCGRCAKACFYNVIDASVTPAVIKKPEDCVNCGFCSGICPTGAMEGGDAIGGFGGQENAMPKSTGDNRFMKSADFLEATGRFRRLVREEDMDWNISLAEAKGKPPRFKEIP